MSSPIELNQKIISTFREMEAYEQTIGLSTSQQQVECVEQKIVSCLQDIQHYEQEIQKVDEFAKPYLSHLNQNLKEKHEKLAKSCQEKKTFFHLEVESTWVTEELKDISTRVSRYLRKSEEFLLNDETFSENLNQLKSRIQTLSNKISQITSHNSYESICKKYEQLGIQLETLEKKGPPPSSSNKKAFNLYSSTEHFYQLLKTCQNKKVLDPKTQTHLLWAFCKLPQKLQHSLLEVYDIKLQSIIEQSASLFDVLNSSFKELNASLNLPPPPSLDTEEFDSWLIEIERVIKKEFKIIVNQDNETKLCSLNIAVEQLQALKRLKEDLNNFLKSALIKFHADPHKVESYFLEEIKKNHLPSPSKVNTEQNPYLLLEALNTSSENKEVQTDIKNLYEKIIRIAASDSPEEIIKQKIKELLSQSKTSLLKPVFQKVFDFSRDGWKDLNHSEEWGKDHVLDNLAVLIGAFHYCSYENSEQKETTMQFINGLITIEHEHQQKLFKQFASLNLPNLHVKIFEASLGSWLKEDDLEQFKKIETESKEAQQKAIQGFSSLLKPIASSSPNTPNDLSIFFTEQKKRAEAVLNQIKESLEGKCDAQTANKLINQSPFLEKIISCQCSEISPTVHQDLITRSSFLEELKIIQNNAKSKHALFFEEGDLSFVSLLKSLEIFLLSSSHLLNNTEKDVITSICIALKDILNQEYDEPTKKRLFGIVLRHFAFHVREDTLKTTEELRHLQQNAEIRFLEGHIYKSNNGTYKNIYQLKQEETAIAKYKPLSPSNAFRERSSYVYDEIFGTKMATPTTTLALSLRKEMTKIANLYEKGRSKQAESLFEKVPDPIKYVVYEELHYFTETPTEQNIGHDAFWELNGKKVSDQQRAKAIKNALLNFKFREYENTHILANEQGQGSLQAWLTNVKPAIEVLEKDPNGGEKLKNIPKPLVQLHAALHLIKGSGDCSGFNTFLHMDSFNTEKERIINLVDFDDEITMPEENKFWHVRMWQFGLPQCGKPFDRSTLILLSDKSFIHKIVQYHRFEKSSFLESKKAYEAQKERLEIIYQRCKQELEKETVTLTPRDLFFAIYPDSKKQYEVKKELGWNDLRIFEYGMGDMNRDCNYWDDRNNPDNKTFNNLEVLYS